MRLVLQELTRVAKVNTTYASLPVISVGIWYCGFGFGQIGALFRDNFAASGQIWQVMIWSEQDIDERSELQNRHGIWVPDHEEHGLE